MSNWVHTNSPDSVCIGDMPVGECPAVIEAVRGGLEWFRDPDSQTAQLCLSADVFVSPHSAQAACQQCARLCIARFGIKPPETTEQLLACDLTPSEIIEFHFPAAHISTSET